MRRGVQLGRPAGIPLRVGASWLIVIPLVAIALFAGIPASAGELWARLTIASLGTSLMFSSVVIHELGHAVVARSRGLDVEQIVVFLFGGYSEMDLDTASSGDDIVVSAAGPGASMLLAVATMGLAFVVPEWAGAQRTVALLGVVNLGVALFNLFPGFPLDGGRIVRAVLIRRGIPPRRAETVTARLGIVIGAGAVVLGAWFSVRGEPASLVALPVGLMVVVIAAAAHPRRDRAPVPQEAYEEI